MAPERTETRVLHGQQVVVKVYPAQKSVDRGAAFNWGTPSRLSVDYDALSEPMSEKTRRDLAKPSPATYEKAT